MAKVILQYPYAMKPDTKKQKYDQLKKDWDNGFLIVEGYVQVTVLKDTDVIMINDMEDIQKDGSSHEGS